MPTTELANTDTAYNTINYLSLHLIDRNFFSPIYIVVRAVRNCVLSENWREYKSDKKSKSSGEIGGGSSAGEVWRIEVLPENNSFLERSLNEENNSTGVYKYISIRIPLDYIFDCIKKVYFVNLL